ncbi:hypothetical protein [Hydrogenophaga sp. PAMC20947]|uniref:hypothetical protein n=1 Tax=Hydrogenophaga sp. PAMC20947 TaxID=2565558 RepID=UPI001444DFF7|nr:hypothetical protein [Hydrogenophaga sp. PAMC20947]
MHGIDSVQHLSISIGLGNTDFGAGIVKEMAVQIPIGALATLASKVRASEQ